MGPRRVAQALVRDLLLKQSLLNTLQHEVDRSAAGAEQAGWRLKLAEKKIYNLQCDIAQLEALLQAEREASIAATEAEGQSLNDGADDFEAMSSEEAAARARALQKALVREQRRAADLEAQLQRLHSSVVDQKELKQRFKELQEAHMQQGQQLRVVERDAQRVPQYLLAIKSQESVIARMETMLKETVKERQEAQTLRAEVARLTASNKELRSIRGSGEVDELQTRLSDAVESEADARQRLTEDAQDRVRAMMRAETAEAQCTALSEELMDSTRRYAREISSLKAQLAEKDAQLMGGFGSLSNLMLGGDLNSTSLAPVRPVSNPLRNSLQTTGKAQSNASPIVDHQLSPTGVPSHRESSPAGLGSNSLNRHQPLGSTRNGSGDVSRSVPHTPTGNHQTPINPSISNRVLAPLNTHGGPATPPKRGASPSSSPRQPALPLSSSPRGYPRLSADALLAHPRGSSLGPSETEPGGRPASRGSTRLSASRPPLSPTAAARGRRSVDPSLGGSPQAGQQRREITRERRPCRTGLTGGRPLGSGAPRSDAHHRLQSSRPPSNPTHPKEPHSSAKTPQYSGRAYHSQRSFSTVSDEEMGAAAERMLSLAKTDDFLDSHRGLLGTSDSEYSDDDDDAYSDDEDDYSSDDGEQAVEPSRPHYLAAAAPRVAAT